MAARDGRKGEADAHEGGARHPIGVVASRSGLSAHVLRAWERRYGVVEPERTEGGHRLYSDADVQRLRLLHELTRRGRRIGRIADRRTEELERLLREDRAAEVTAPGGEGADASDRERVEELLAEARAAVDEFAAERLDALLRRAALSLSVVTFVDALVGPLLDDLGRAWADGEIRPAHEHVASVIVARVAGWLMDNFEPESGAPCLVVGTLPGHRHELGALSAALTAASDGWRVRYMGADLPAEELALAAREASAGALALSIVFPADDEDTAEELRRLRTQLPAGTPLLVGGAASGSYAPVLEEIDAVRLDGYRSLRAVLRSLRSGVTGPGSGT